MTQTDKSWLVRSSTRILGPFDLEGIRQLILNKQISVIDEVRSTSGRWTYIRESSHFKEVVEQIRAELRNMSEETMTQSIAHSSLSKTDALTENTQNLSDEMTPTPVGFKARQAAGESEVKDITSARENNVSSKSTAVSYGSLNDFEVHRKLEEKSKVMRWMVVGLTLVVIAGAIYNFRKKANPTGLTYNDYITAAYKYKSLGLYEMALKNYRKAENFQNPNQEVKAAMAPLLIQAEGQTLAGRRILDKYLVNRELSRSEIAEVNLSLAVSYMMDKDYAQAEKALNKVVVVEPNNKFLRYNQAALAFEKGDLAQAYKGFNDIFGKVPDFKEALIGKAVSALAISFKENSTQLLEELIPDLSRASEQSYLRHEVLVVLATVYSELGNLNGVQKTINQFLATLPVLTTKFAQPLYVFQGIYRWERLENMCGRIQRVYPGYTEGKAFYAQCLKRANRDQDSQKLINEAFKESPKSPYVLMAMANEYIDQNRLMEAESILKQPEMASMPNRDLLKGHICLTNKDVSCAKDNFANSYRRANREILNYYGLAWIAQQSEDRNMAYHYINEGLQLAPNFKPLIQLRDQVESK